jgi:hypothetical protein
MQIFCSPFSLLSYLVSVPGHEQRINNKQTPVSLLLLLVVVVVVVVIIIIIIIVGKVKVNLTLEQAIKAQRESIGIALLFL